MIDIENLSLTRSGAPILHDVSVEIPSGGITALIGPNGAGKSTLLHAVAGLLAPETGRIAVEGTDIGQSREPERAQIMALLTQSHNVTARLTVRELVAFGRWPHHRGRPRAEDHAATDDAIRTFSLGDLADRRLDSLSGGQGQRAFVAMAYAQSTPWLLLDEPLAALDPRYAREIMESLHEVTRPHREDSRSALIVLHDLNMAAKYADHCVAMKDGRVLHAGPRADTLTETILSTLYDTPITVGELGAQDVIVYA